MKRRDRKPKKPGRFRRFVGRFVVNSVVASVKNDGFPSWVKDHEKHMNIAEPVAPLEPLEPTQEKHMKETKSVFESKTLQGIAVMLAPVILNLVGVEVNEGESNAIMLALPNIVTAFGALWAIIGRFTASKNLTLIR